MSQITSSTAVDLMDVKDPQFIIRVGGKDYEYDPFAVVRKLEDAGIEKGGTDVTTVNTITSIRKIFGFPGSGEATTDGRPVLSDNQTLVLLQRFMAFLKELEVLKNLHALTQT